MGLIVELGCERPRYIPVMADTDARADSCVANVYRAIGQRGGEITYGWILRESLPIYEPAHVPRRAHDGGLLVVETPRESTQYRGKVHVFEERT